MAEREVGADSDGGLVGGDEPSGEEVDGRDVVGVEGVAEAEGVGEDGGGEEVRVEGLRGLAGGWDHAGMNTYEGDADTGPNNDVDGNEKEDDANYGRGESPEAGDAGVVVRRFEEGGGGRHGGTVQVCAGGM